MEMTAIRTQQQHGNQLVTDPAPQSVTANNLLNNSIQAKSTIVTDYKGKTPIPPKIYEKHISKGYTGNPLTIGYYKNEALNNSELAVTDQEQGKEQGHQAASFMTYLRTLQLLKLRLKGVDEGKSVHIPQKEIETRFFVYPQHDRKTELQKLIDQGELEVTETTSPTTGRKIKFYRCLVAGAVDFSMMPNREPLPPLEASMMATLLHVTLHAGAPSTPYFDTFLRYRKDYIRQFFTIDSFAGRVHTPITNFHRTHRPNILLHGSTTISFDVKQMQPLLLGKILQDNIGANEFSQWIEQGQDVYVMLQQAAKLETRDQGKKRFFEILFSPANDDLVKLFGSANWIDWLNEYKRKGEPRNPYNAIKKYGAVSWLLTKTEVQVMRKVWQALTVPFLSVHDEIICREQDRAQAEGTIRKVLDQELKQYTLNVNKGIEAKATAVGTTAIATAVVAEASLMGSVHYLLTRTDAGDTMEDRHSKKMPLHDWIRMTAAAACDGCGQSADEILALYNVISKQHDHETN